MRPPVIAFPALLQDFFHQRLIAQRGASAQTIASYRDTFEIFLRYAEQSTARSPSALTLEDLDAPVVRKCSPRPVWCRGAGWAETMGGCGIGGRRYASSRARGTVTAPG